MVNHMITLHISRLMFLIQLSIIKRFYASIFLHLSSLPTSLLRLISVFAQISLWSFKLSFYFKSFQFPVRQTDIFSIPDHSHKHFVVLSFLSGKLYKGLWIRGSISSGPLFILFRTFLKVSL